MRNRRDYAVITGSYWVFTLTDGALRMLVLFHLHELGFSPLQVVSLFLLYEIFGVVTNFVGGWLGARFGLKSTLFTGLGLQVLSCATLASMADQLTVPLVMAAQGCSGIAKDLTKMSSKSYIKLVVPESDSSGLLRWVAVLTGSKNALKGVGFFLGGVLLQSVGFRDANLLMATALVAVLVAAVVMLPGAGGRARTPVGFRSLISTDARVQWLAAARLFLFASRDVWFVFALPIFLSVDLGWSFAESGGFLAVWVIGYGLVQALAPAYIGERVGRRAAPGGGRVLAWTALLAVPLLGIAAALSWSTAPGTALTLGLAGFGFVFATTSAMHSYLIVHYADVDRVSLNVGFYYTANSLGRLVGTVLSGAVFQWAGMGTPGLITCLSVSVGFALVSAGLCLPLRAAEARVSGGSSAPRVRP